MTIDETIAHAREKAKEQKSKYDKCPTRLRYNCEMCFHNTKCDEDAEYHEQLAEWLEELKAYKEKPEGWMWDEAEQKGYNKAVDDFAEKAIKIVYESNNREINPQPRDMVADIHYKLLEIAEKLKAGENDEMEK